MEEERHWKMPDWIRMIMILTKGMQDETADRKIRVRG